jgi:hypothetical protein
MPDTLEIPDKAPKCLITADYEVGLVSRARSIALPEPLVH